MKFHVESDTPSTQPTSQKSTSTSKNVLHVCYSFYATVFSY